MYKIEAFLMNKTFQIKFKFKMQIILVFQLQIFGHQKLVLHNSYQDG